MPEQECIFCSIVSGKVPSRKVYEDDSVVAVLDINPAAPGHVLVIPKEHVGVMPQMGDDLTKHFGVVAKKLSHELIKKLGVEGVSVFIANGAAAGQRAPHFMMHVIPRRQDDGIQLSAPVAKIPDEQMKALFEQMRPAVDKNFRGIAKEKKQIGSPELDDIANLLVGK